MEFSVILMASPEVLVPFSPLILFGLSRITALKLEDRPQLTSFDVDESAKESKAMARSGSQGT